MTDERKFEEMPIGEVHGLVLALQADKAALEKRVADLQWELNIAQHNARPPHPAIADRDKYGQTISAIRGMCIAAGVGDHVTATTDIVKAALKELTALRSEITAKRRDRIGDSEIAGAYLSRAENAERVIKEIAEVCREAGLEDGEVYSTFLRNSFEHYRSALSEIERTKAELHTAVHDVNTGQPLHELVDAAIDRERNLHFESLEIVAKALGQEWSTAVALVNTYRDWASHLANVISHDFVKKVQAGDDVVIDDDYRKMQAHAVEFLRSRNFPTQSPSGRPSVSGASASWVLEDGVSEIFFPHLIQRKPPLEERVAALERAIGDNPFAGGLGPAVADFERRICKLETDAFDSKKTSRR